MSFSKDFLWGTSISAAQAEGGWNEGANYIKFKSFDEKV